MKIVIERPALRDLYRDPAYWREAVYDRKLLILRGLHLTVEQYYDLHKLFGKPWLEPHYRLSHELPTRVKSKTTGVERVYTSYSNVLTSKAIGNASMGWHRDIPYHRFIRYPLRSLYPVKLPSNPGATRFMDADVLLERSKFDLSTVEVQIQSWYEVAIFDNPEPQRKWIPLLEEHPHTKRTSVLLNAPGDRGWVRALRTKDGEPLDVKLMGQWLWLCDTPDNVYSHEWELGDFILFDNHSGLMHGRDALPTDEERAFWRINVRHAWQN